MDTKTALLDSAERFARTRGFNAFSYADLSDAIGIRKASIHYHFATKADLAEALIARYSDGFAARLNAIDTRHETAAARLEAYLDLYRDALDQGAQVCLCVAFSAARDSFNPATLNRLNQFHENSQTWLTLVFSLGSQDGTLTNSPASAEADALACLALVEGAQLIARAATDTSRFDLCIQPLLGRITSPTTPH